MAALGTRLLTITVNGVAYTSSVSNATLTPNESDSDFVTFADAAAGGAFDWVLGFTAVQDLAAGSLWREMWDNAGDTVPFVLAPYGNATPAAGQGHIVGSAVITLPAGNAMLGGEANPSTTARFTVEAEWPCTAKPVLDETP
jgi:hypothetical protein